MGRSQEFPLPWETLPRAPKRHRGIPPEAKGQGTAGDTSTWIKHPLRLISFVPHLPSTTSSGHFPPRWDLLGLRAPNSPVAPSPGGPASLAMLGFVGFFSPLLQNQDMEEKKINPPNIPASWKAWCEVTLEMGAQNQAGTRPWGAEEMNLPKPALWGLACADRWSSALICGPQH